MRRDFVENTMPQPHAIPGLQSLDAASTMIASQLDYRKNAAFYQLQKLTFYIPKLTSPRMFLTILLPLYYSIIKFISKK